ncbi:hypothetical protein AYO20_09085 [Fonsecaea nubica]|uniref:Cytochrome P450 n=1 Tax=Fonsecaea nubica TaxID=856822 RepID=A0A178CL41_9EURO|nr:hypothetical protein AYO20_09085 [Fonsecaea nubica]OAL29793.1 hypothetical protein AYO20_09085 [Fonsecaea nubica]
MWSLLESPLTGNIRTGQVAVLASISVLIVIALFNALLAKCTGAHKLPDLPIALQEELPNEKDRIERYVNDTRELLIHGYRVFKDQVFGINTTEGTNIVLPLKYLDDLKGQRTLTFAAFLEEQFTLKEYTKLGNLTEAQIQVYIRDFNPLLPQYVPTIHRWICEYFPIGECESWTTTKPYVPLNRLVSRICARMFLGEAAARDDRWLDVAAVYIKTVEHWITNLKKWPKSLRPLVWRFVDGRRQAWQQFEEGRMIVSESLRKKKANGNKPLNDPPSLMDCLTSDQYSDSINDTEYHTIAQMNLCVAAIQAQAATVMQCLIDASGYPEYIPELREEIEQTLQSSGGVWTKQALDRLLKLDSFLKETQRLNSPDLTSYQRRVMQPLTLSNGMRIPRGATLVIPTGAINMDGQYFESPEQFDGFRFYRKRSESEDNAKKHQLVTVGKYDLAWGYGRHACPGRFLADIVMKLIMIEFLTRYDVKYPTSRARPENVIYEGIVSVAGDMHTLPRLSLSL